MKTKFLLLLSFFVFCSSFLLASAAKVPASFPRDGEGSLISKIQFRENLPDELKGFLEEMCLSARTHSVKSKEAIFSSGFQCSPEILSLARLFIKKKRPEDQRDHKKATKEARLLATIFHYLKLRGCLTPEQASFIYRVALSLKGSRRKGLLEPEVRQKIESYYKEIEESHEHHLACRHLKLVPLASLLRIAYREPVVEVDIHDEENLEKALGFMGSKFEEEVFWKFK